MKIRAIIVDDEPHAREGIRLRLKGYSEVQVIEECSSGKKAVAAINALHPDLIFLDIQMPEMNGFEVLQKIKVEPVPFVIFVTAFDKYAIQAFEYHALDYLLKPINEMRFKEALHVVVSEINHRNLEIYANKLKSAVSDYLSYMEKGDEETQLKVVKGPKGYLNRLMIKSREQISMISVDDVDWIESAGDYVYVHSKSQKHIVRETLTSLEQRLNPAKFIRIHRSTIVNMEQIKTLKGNEHGDYDVFLLDNTKLKLSRSYRAHFESIVKHII